MPSYIEPDPMRHEVDPMRHEVDPFDPMPKREISDEMNDDIHNARPGVIRVQNEQM